MMNAGKLTYALVLSLLPLCGQTWALDPVDHQPIPDLAKALKSSGQVRIAQGMQTILATNDAGQPVPAAAPLLLTTNQATGEWTISVLNDKTVGSTALIGAGIQQVSSNDVPALPSFDRAKAQAIVAATHARGAAYYPDEIQRLMKESNLKRAYSGQVSFVLNSALAMAAAYNQYQIDSNLITFKIDGKDVQLTQGALRKIMIDRVAALEAKRAQLQATNADADEIAQTDALLKRYTTQKGQLGDPATPDFTSMKPVFMDLLTVPGSDEFRILVVDQYGACVELAAGNSFGPKS